jgi:cytochrome b subunit of formate dehydrogenase
MSESTAKTYLRFPLARRIEHILMVLSFSTLGLTGLPQKYPTSEIAIAFVNLLGGIESLRLIHHTAAIVMMFGTAYHLLVMGYSVFVLRSRMSMLPTLQDARDGWQALLYNLGFAKTYPQMGRYTFEEKMEYWAFVWGAVVMGATGFLMWNPITATQIFPGEFVPAAKAAHGGEAVLAVLAIIIWHIYGVHIKRFNKAMFTGMQTEAEMLHEHPLELADIKAGIADRRPDAATIRKRQTVYFPIAAILTLGMLSGIYGFINAEETALTTVPPQPDPIEIYVPQTMTPAATLTPTPNPTNTAGPNASLDSKVGALVAQKCNSCQRETGEDGPDLPAYAGASTAAQVER